MREIGSKENCVFGVGQEKWGGGSKFSSVQFSRSVMSNSL